MCKLKSDDATNDYEFTAGRCSVPVRAAFLHFRTVVLLYNDANVDIWTHSQKKASIYAYDGLTKDLVYMSLVFDIPHSVCFDILSNYIGENDLKNTDHSICAKRHKLRYILVIQSPRFVLAAKYSIGSLTILTSPLISQNAEMLMMLIL